MTEQIGNIPESDRTTNGIPKVSLDIVNAFRAEPHKFDELFNSIRNTNPELARYIMTRAAELGGENMRAREDYSRLALEALGILLSQVQATTLDKQLDDMTNDPQPPLAA